MDDPLGSVVLGETDELKRLRRRAYGPDADIAGDAAAQARLSELEAAQRRQVTLVVDAAPMGPAPVPERAPVPARVRVRDPVAGSLSASASVQPVDRAFAEDEPGAGSVTEQDPTEGPTADSYPIDGAPAPWWRRRRWLFAVLGGALAALALNAALVAWMSWMLAGGSSPNPSVPDGVGRGDNVSAPDFELTLVSVGGEADAPNDRHGTLDALGVSTEKLRRYEDFRDLNVWSGESRYGMTCLFVAVPVQGLREGFGAEGCSPEGLDTVVDLLYSDNDLTRFVLRGDQVNVYVYVRAANPSASPG